MITITNQEEIDNLKTAYKTNGGEWGKYNLGGIRNPSGQARDIWNDVIFAATNDMLILCQGTTDPGRRGTEKSVKGVCHMVEGFHKNAWAIGWHGGKDKAWRHEAFVQVASIPYWRDKDRDFEISGADQVIYDEPASGLNIHSTMGKPEEIGGWSIGCQVIRDMAEFRKVIDMAKKSGFPLFSYMLFSRKREVEELYNKLYQ